MNLVRRIIARLVAHLDPPRVIYDRAGGSPYLSRYYVFGAPKADDGLPVFNEYGNPRDGITWNDRSGPVGVYLHKFHRGDDDEQLHNHPWSWSVSLILAGGYREERRMHGFARKLVELRVLRPGMLNVIRGDDFHRVDLLEDDAWSLFIAGPRVSSWSFWDRKTGETTPWRTFIARKRGVEESDLRTAKKGN